MRTVGNTSDVLFKNPDLILDELPGVFHGGLSDYTIHLIEHSIDSCIRHLPTRNCLSFLFASKSNYEPEKTSNFNATQQLVISMLNSQISSMKKTGQLPKLLEPSPQNIPLAQKMPPKDPTDLDQTKKSTFTYTSYFVVQSLEKFYSQSAIRILLLIYLL